MPATWQETHPRLADDEPRYLGNSSVDAAYSTTNADAGQNCGLTVSNLLEPLNKSHVQCYIYK